MIGSTSSAGRHFSRGLYLVGGTLVLSAITIVMMRFAIGAETNSNERKSKVH